MALGQAGSITMSSAGMAALQQALMRAALGTPAARGDAARMLSDPGMFGMADLPVDAVKPPLLASLTQVQRQAGGESDARGALMVMELLPLLLQKVKEEGTPLDQMTVELVSVVFDYIYADRSLAEPVKHQLLRLQVVAVKAALLDRSFFARRQHPMRQLIDRITPACFGPRRGPGGGLAAGEGALEGGRPVDRRVRHGPLDVPHRHRPDRRTAQARNCPPLR